MSQQQVSSPGGYQRTTRKSYTSTTVEPQAPTTFTTMTSQVVPTMNFQRAYELPPVQYVQQVEPVSPLYSPVGAYRQHRQSYQSQTAMSPVQLPAFPSPAPIRTSQVVIPGGITTQTQVQTIASTVVQPPPAIFAGNGDWRNAEIMMAEEERMLRFKEEELRQRESILHLQKLNIKKAEIEARRSAVMEKEAQLMGVQQEILGIQTGIANIKNSQVLEMLSERDHREMVNRSRVILSPPIVTHVPGELVEVSTTETKTIAEEIVTPPRVDYFASYANSPQIGYSTGFNRY